MGLEPGENHSYPEATTAQRFKREEEKKSGHEHVRYCMGETARRRAHRMRAIRKEGQISVEKLKWFTWSGRKEKKRPLDHHTRNRCEGSIIKFQEGRRSLRTSDKAVEEYFRKKTVG